MGIGFEFGIVSCEVLSDYSLLELETFESDWLATTQWALGWVLGQLGPLGMPPLGLYQTQTDVERSGEEMLGKD
ncbi:hypothetical protein PanWU01x14_353840 [Parasponia andersonii]|uniref:Uncharacterized protein n=1 Tax=Parasponia andersonii TaxID=3476 RepID=A0A2P5A9V4_PARAD|nr:hypothetical protein PanWU01x14_353840 [Parasponia andersonii]